MPESKGELQDRSLKLGIFFVRKSWISVCDCGRGISWGDGED